MVLDDKKAYEDFETIKTTLEQSRKDYDGYSIILFQYGLIQFILLTLSYVIGSLAIRFNGYVIVIFAIDILLDLYLIILFLKVYRAENMTSNKYYLSCISMWGIIIISLPFINLAIRITILSVASNISNLLLVKLTASTMLINILLFCFSMIICGFITNKKGYLIMSLVIFYVYLELSTLFFDTTISKVGTQVLNIFYYAFITIGYIGLSFILRRGINNGYK